MLRIPFKFDWVNTHFYVIILSYLKTIIWLYIIDILKFAMTYIRCYFLKLYSNFILLVGVVLEATLLYNFEYGDFFANLTKKIAKQCQICPSSHAGLFGKFLRYVMIIQCSHERNRMLKNDYIYMRKSQTKFIPWKIVLKCLPEIYKSSCGILCTLY